MTVDRIDPVLVEKGVLALVEVYGSGRSELDTPAVEAAMRVFFDELGLKEEHRIGDEDARARVLKGPIGPEMYTPEARWVSDWRPVEQGDQEYWRKRAEAKLAMAVGAFEAILGAEEECGRYSGSQRLAEVAIDRTVLFLRTYGLLSDEKLAELERRGSIGGETRQALSEIEQGDAK